MVIYAWVTAQNCVYQRAVLPNTEVGGRPVSRHGDYVRWGHGRRETLRLMESGTTSRTRNLARLVAELKGWL